jgi:nucleoside-diphosphate-sugar epimerase
MRPDEAAANVAVTAKSLGVKAFVNLSQMTVSEMSETETTSSPQQKQHWLAEQMLRWSGLPVVYLRPTAFFDGLFLVQGAKGIRDDNVIRLPFADGKTALIAGADVGVAAAAVLANPEPHIGKVYELTGPQLLTMAQYAQEFSRALGRTIQYVNVPAHIWEAKLQERASNRTLDHYGRAASRQPLRPDDRLLPAVSRACADFRRRIRAPPRGRIHACSSVRGCSERVAGKVAGLRVN